MYCPKCGKEIKETSKFCPYCGNEVQEKKETFNRQVNSKQDVISGQQKLLIVSFGVIIVGVIIAFVIFQIYMKNKQEMRQQNNDTNHAVNTSEMSQPTKEEEENTTQLVEENTEEIEDTDIVKYMYVDYVSQAIYLREEPTENSSNITTIPLGTEVGFIKKIDSTFAMINYNGKIGYVKLEYLSDLKPDTTVKYEMYIANVNESVTLRKAPSTNGEAVCKILLSEKVGVIEETNAMFSKVRYGDRIGYVMSQYLSSSEPKTTISYYMYVDNVSKAIKLRKSPTENSDSYFDISLGAEVGVIEEVNTTYAKIVYDGQIGYTKSEYLSITRPNTTVSEYMYITNVKNSAYFRVKPREDDSKSNIICEIPLGEEVGVIESYDYTFAKVKYDGRVGYIKWEYLSY